MEYNPQTHSENSEAMELYKSQAKRILKKLSPRSEPRLSLESGSYTFHYLIQRDVCYLTLCDKGYPKRLAFVYLDDIHNSFVQFLDETEAKKAQEEKRQPMEWTRVVDLVGRPYAYIKFDKTIKRKGKEFANPASRSNTNRLNEDLADTMNIMKKNINEVLKRGDNIEHMQNVTGDLKNQAQSFRWGAKKVNLMAQWQQVAPFVAVGVVLLVILLLKICF